MRNLLADDLDRVLEEMGALWDDLRGARIFMTGGTGFFGCWLLETLLWANQRRGLGASVTVLTRRPDAFADRLPHLTEDPALTIRGGDVRTLDWDGSAFSHAVHAATDARPPRTDAERRDAFDTIVFGTRRVLEFAERAGVRRLLLASSGAVYGRQPSSVTHLSEDYAGGPDPLDPNAFYAEGKRAAEMLCVLHATAGLRPVIARGFAFVGPYLPLDRHFAVGNFLRDAMNGGPIRIVGDGTPWRSYLYGADLASWLWTILLRGVPLRPYNVGSADRVSIRELADEVAAAAGPSVAVSIARPPAGGPADSYVPDVMRAEAELGLRVRVSRREAISRTLAWHRAAAAVGTAHR